MPPKRNKGGLLLSHPIQNTEGIGIAELSRGNYQQLAIMENVNGFKKNWHVDLNSQNES